MKAKRILYCEGNLDGTVGGSYYVLFDLVKSLDKSKYYPIVVFYKDNILVPQLQNSGIETHVLQRPESVVLGKRLRGRGGAGRIVFLALRPVQRGINFLKRIVIPAVRIARFLKARKVDLVNLNNSITRNHEWMLGAWFASVKCMTHEMGINRSFSLTSRFLGRRMQAVICVSNAVSGNMRKCGLNWPNIHTVHCGIDLTRYTRRVSDADLRERYRITPKSPVIGVVGNIKEWKGQETVVRAVALIKQQFPDIKCLLVGDNSPIDRYYKQRLDQICDSLDITENIIFCGFQKNVIDYMSIMDVVIHSSILPEPFGIVNLEAMSLKKPVVSTKIGGPAEIFGDGKSSILVNPGKPDELAAAVLDLLNDPSKAIAMGKAAYTRLSEEFTLDQNVARTVAIYDSILDGT